MRALGLALLLSSCGGAAASSSATTSDRDPPPADGRTGPDTPIAPGLACASDDDCVLVPGVCGGVEPTNRTHEEETRESVRMRQTVASCMAPATPEPAMAARCVGGECTAIAAP